MERIVKYINRIYRTSILDRSFALKGTGVSGPQLSYLLHINHLPGITQDELAAIIYVNKSTVARQVNSLENNGLIERIPDPNDRRRLQLYPTQLGKDILPQLIDTIQDFNDDILVEFSEEEQETLRRFLIKMSERATARIQSIEGTLRKGGNVE